MPLTEKFAANGSVFAMAGNLLTSSLEQMPIENILLKIRYIAK